LAILQYFLNLLHPYLCPFTYLQHLNFLCFLAWWWWWWWWWCLWWWCKWYLLLHLHVTLLNFPLQWQCFLFPNLNLQILKYFLNLWHLILWPLTHLQHFNYLGNFLDLWQCHLLCLKCLLHFLNNFLCFLLTLLNLWKRWCLLNFLNFLLNFLHLLLKCLLWWCNFLHLCNNFLKCLCNLWAFLWWWCHLRRWILCLILLHFLNNLQCLWWILCLNPANLAFHHETTFLPSLNLVTFQYFLNLLQPILYPLTYLQHFNFLWHL
jgi:hypothetical protein